MEWTLQNPNVMLVALLVAAALAGGIGLGARHSRAARAGALLARVLIAVSLCLLLARPSVVAEAERRFEPEGTWRLLLGNAAQPSSSTDFVESPARFVARVRGALAGGSPPERCEVHGDGPQVRATVEAVSALGMPCTAVLPSRQGAASGSTGLLRLAVPPFLQPGEPLQIEARTTSSGRLHLLLDDDEVAHKVEGELATATVPGLAPGRHVVEARVLGESGQLAQHAGAVVRVGARPKLLLLGMSESRAEQALSLAPSFDSLQCAVTEFDEQRVSGCDVVLAGIDALYALSSRQAFVLSSFVARGGGLYATGDGARHVAPEFLPQDIAALLPVTLLPEPEAEDPPKPPVIETPTITEVAKVSICYVIDRSGSMDALIGISGLSRWQVACKGVIESMARLSIDARASVMAFTLDQNWLTRNSRTGKPEPRVFLEGNRLAMEGTLAKLATDGKYDDAWFNTDIYAAVEAAIAVMKDEPSAVKMIIMLTDGGDRPATQATGKRHTTLRDLAEQNGINIVAIGIGEGFAGESPEAASARAVINDLATRPRHDPRRSFAFLPASAEDAARAHAIFVSSVETAFEIFDDKKRREEEERQQRLLEQKKDKEPPKVDALAGVFALELRPAGARIFGADTLPRDAPRLRWYARNVIQREAVAALTVRTDDARAPAALALGSWGFGRVAFWSAGTSSEALGEVAGWPEFPALFAASLRWLTPQTLPNLQLAQPIGRESIALPGADPSAQYTLERPGSAPIILAAAAGRLVGPEEKLPLGAFEVIQTFEGQRESVGDVFITNNMGDGAVFEAAPPAVADTVRTLPPAALTQVKLSEPVILYVGAFILILLSLERLLRRRV